MTTDEIEALEKQLREPKQWSYNNGGHLLFASSAPFEAAAAIAHLRAEVERLTREKQEWWEAANDFDAEGNETLWKDIADAEHAKVERLTRERDEAVALNSVNESGANSALDLLESMKTLCEAHMARAEAAERELALVAVVVNPMWQAKHDRPSADWIIDQLKYNEAEHQKDHDAAERQVATLREALEFYSNRMTYTARSGMECGITRDHFGDKARAAIRNLAKEPPK